MYGGCIEVWGKYRCMGKCTDIWVYADIMGMYKGHTNIQGVYRCMGAYKCMGDVQIYGEYLDVLGLAWDTWEVYKHTGGIQMYWVCTGLWGAYRCIEKCTDVWGCTDVRIIQTAPRHTDSQTYTPTCLPAMPGYYISYKFRFVPYRHILLAHHLV